MVLAEVPTPDHSFTFGQNVLLIFITAVIVGLAVPLVKGVMDRQRDRRQRLFEVALDRDSKVVERQYELVKELSQEAWAIVGLTMPVTYYKSVKEATKFESAWNRYETEWFPTMLRFRALVSQARRLVSPGVHGELVSLFDYWFRESDPQLSAKVRAGGDDTSSWEAQHQERLAFVFSETERVLGLTAEDVGIVRTGLPSAVLTSGATARHDQDEQVLNASATTD